MDRLGAEGKALVTSMDRLGAEGTALVTSPLHPPSIMSRWVPHGVQGRVESCISWRSELRAHTHTHVHQCQPAHVHVLEHVAQ